MRFLQVVILVAVCAAAKAGYIGRTGYSGLSQFGSSGYYPGNHGGAVNAGYNAYPKYSFDYAVNDPHTGDHKTQWESRDGDVVKGAYSLLEPDGTTRIVEYTADKIHGFNAVVRRVGQAQHPQPARYNPYKQTGFYAYH